MEEEYFLYNNTLYSKDDLSKKYGESVDQKINEFGFEKAYQYNDVVYSSSQLKSKYGDDYESVIETKGITPYGVKKKVQNQPPQEEAITEDSSTVAEPLQESGGETEQDGGLENPMALYGKYQQKNTALSELNNQIDYQESLDSPDQESIAELKRKRNELSSEVKTTASELVSPISNRELPKYYNEDGEIKDEYVTTNIYDFKVPDLDKIQEDADRLFTDPALKRKYQKDIENSLQFSIDVPKEKLQEKVNEVYKNEFGQPLDEAIEKSQVDAFNNTYGGKLKKELSGVNYKIKEAQDLYSEELSKINTEATVKAEQLGNEYKQAIAEIQQKPVASEEDRKRLQREADNLYSNYSKSVDEIISNSVDIENQYNAKINQYAQEQYENYNNKVKEFTDKFQKEYKISPEIAKNLQSASNKAASELLKESNKKKEENIKLSGGYSGGSYYGRLATSTLSSLGGVLSGWATAFGGTGEFGDKVQQYFQPAVSPIKSLKDLTIYSLTESGGNLTGSMLPSVLAGITSGVLTRNAGLTTRIVATGAAGWATETVDIAGRQYKEALERTGSTAEAENAASEAIDGQIMLSPTYLLEGLPFIGAFKKISNPVLRVGTGAAVEYTGELMQEYPQGLMEEQIVKTGEVEGFTKRASLESLSETALNLIPTLGLGAAGAINKEVDSILKTNPDIGMQQLGDVIYKKGKAAANLQISQLYSQGMIDKETFEFLGTQIEGFDVDNSKEYNALKFKRDQVAMSIDKESDPVKQKVLKDTVKAYDTMLEMSILGENVSMPQIEANGITYTVVTNNPIEWLKSREEQSKSEEKTTAEQYGDKKEVVVTEQEGDVFSKRESKINEKYDRLVEKARKKYGENSKSEQQLEEKRKKDLEILEDRKQRKLNKEQEEQEDIDFSVIPLDEVEAIEQELETEPKTEKPTMEEDGTISDGKRRYEVVSIETKKNGERVVKAKEILTPEERIKRKSKSGYGVTRRFTGEVAEELAKDSKLDREQSDKKKTKWKTTGEPKVEAKKESPKTFSSKDKVEIEERTEESIQKELDEETESARKDLEQFSDAVMKELGKQADKNKDLIELNGNIYQVTKKEDGTFIVSKMRENDAKLIPMRTDSQERRSAISQYKRKKTTEDKKALNEADALIKEAEKETKDRIESAIQKAIDYLSDVQRNQMRNLNVSFILPELGVATSKAILKAVLVAYKGGLSLKLAIKQAYAKVSDRVSEDDFNRFIINNIKNTLSKSQKESSGAKKPQEKQKTAKTATAEQKSKQSPQDVKKETEGLTEKEVAKQGVEEIVSAYKQKIKDVKRKLNNVIENTKANTRDKIKAIDDARKVITQGIEDFLPKEIRVPKNIVKALNSAKTSKQINNTLDRLINFIERAKVSSIKKDIKENQSKVKKILPKLTNKQPLVEEFLSIDLKEVDDIKLLDEINRELENILNQGVAKLNPKLVEDINAKIEKKKLGKSRVITNESFDRRMSLVDEKDSNYSKVKALDRFILDLESTFLNGEIGETDYNRMKSKIESKIDEVSKGLEDDVSELNNDSKERLKNLNENKFTKLQREEIKKLRFMAGKRLDYKNAVKLNDIVTELELGYIPMQQISQYFVDAKSKIDSDVLSEKMNNRKDFGGKLDRVAKFFGLGRQGELRKSKTTQDAIDILQSLNIGFWDDLFGLGKELTFSGLISNPIDKAIATTSRMVRDIERRFVDIKYSAFGGVKDVDDYAIRIARKQGDWEVMEGNDTDYFSELMQNEEEWSKYSQAEQTLIKKAYDKLPKRNGRIAYDVYLENLKGKQKKLNDFYTQIADELSEYQEITNQRKGKEYKKRDSRYYQTDIVMQDRAKQAEDDLNNFIKSSMGNYVAINAGVGISRVDRTNPVAISLNSERMVARQSTQTLRDYYLSEQINLATKTIGKVKSNLNNKDARIILGQIPEVLRLRLGKEYGIDSNKDAFRRIIHKLLGSARSYYLSGVTRVFGAEIISESIRTLGATRIRQLPRSMAQLIFNNKKVKLNSLKKLLDKTNSPFLEKSYLETSAPDATGEFGKARTIGNKAANVVEKITSKYIGLSSTITFPLLWLPEFNYRFKQLTGENFDMSKFTKDDKYYDKYEQDIITSASFADTQTERVQGGRTRFSRRQQVSWIGTPIYNLKDLITGTETTSKTSSQSAPKYLDAFSTAGILNSFLSNFAFLEDLNVSRGGRELIFGENLNRDRAGRLLAFGVLSGMSYNLAKSYIEHLLSDDDDDFWDKDKIIESAINNFMFLKIGRYGQSAKLALLAITSYLVMTEKDNEKKKKIIELSKDRFQSYPIDLGYGSKEYAITNFADQMIPFTGEVIATGLDGVKTIEDSKEDDINPILATISLANDMMKLYLVSKGTQLPTQRYQDDILSALKKIEKGDEITQNEFDVLNKLGFIDIIDDAVNNARVKTE